MRLHGGGKAPSHPSLILCRMSLLPNRTSRPSFSPTSHISCDPFMFLGIAQHEAYCYVSHSHVSSPPTTGALTTSGAGVGWHVEGKGGMQR